jgi:hypothetical protein
MLVGGNQDHNSTVSSAPISTVQQPQASGMERRQPSIEVSNDDEAQRPEKKSKTTSQTLSTTETSVGQSRASVETERQLDARFSSAMKGLEALVSPQ